MVTCKAITLADVLVLLPWRDTMPAGRFATCRKSSSRAMCLARADTSNRSRLKGCLCGGLQVPYLCKCSDCTARARCAAHRDDLRHVANRPLGLRVSPGRIRSIARASKAVYMVSCTSSTIANVLIVPPRGHTHPGSLFPDLSGNAGAGRATRLDRTTSATASVKCSVWFAWSGLPSGASDKRVSADSGHSLSFFCAASVDTGRRRHVEGLCGLE